jgi:hypothetical protein
MTHAEIAELLGAWALDAVDDDERQAVAAHLDECPRCRAEVAQHLEVVALLANTGANAPEGLWDRIAVELDAGAPPLDLAPVVSLEDARAATDRIVGRSDQRPVGSAARAGRRIRTRTAAVIGAVAAVVIALLGFQIQRLDHRTDRLAAALNAQGAEGRLPTVMGQAGTTTVVLRGGDGQVLATAYVPVTGDAVLDLRALPPLPAGEEYQLWGVEPAETVSLRLLGPRPAITDFRMAPGVQALAVTAERAGGVAVSKQQPVAAGPVSA